MSYREQNSPEFSDDLDSAQWHAAADVRMRNFIPPRKRHRPLCCARRKNYSGMALKVEMAR